MAEDRGGGGRGRRGEEEGEGEREGGKTEKEGETGKEANDEMDSEASGRTFNNGDNSLFLPFIIASLESATSAFEVEEPVGVQREMPSSS